MARKSKVEPKDKGSEVYREALERFKRAVDADSDNAKKALADIKFCFVEGNQWDEAAKKARGNTRPAYEFNRVRQAVRQVLGDQRRQKPKGKVRGVDSSGDPKFAETMTGLIRNIESVSNAERAYDTAFEYAVAGGKGAWRICTEYVDDSAFEQDIRIKEIANPFAVYFDPAAQEWDRRDGEFAFVVERIAKSEFEHRWPDADLADWDSDALHQDWVEDDTVQVAEYWRKVRVQKEICLLSNGATVDKAETEAVLDEMALAGISIVKSRVVDTHKVEQYIVSGGGVCEGPTPFASKYIPVVPCWGDLMCIEGKWRYSGLVRHSKDAQRIHNYQLTTAIEAVALTPKAPFIMTPTQVEGHEDSWRVANTEPMPYLLANSDPAAGGMPHREPPPALPAAQLQLTQIASDELKATSGIYDASLGARSNETSGRAIMARQNEGDTANFAYIDNLARAIKYTYEILLDLIPKIYDTPRVIRVLGEDGIEKYAELNQTVIDQQTGQPVIVNDLSKAKFDAVVTVGPSFQTARMEMVDALTAIGQGNPMVGLLSSDLMLKALDVPGADELAKRARKAIELQMPGVIEQEGQQEIPPQVQAMIAQGKQILDQQAAAIQDLQMMLQKAAAEIQTLKADEAGKQADHALRLEELELERAQLAAKVLELQSKHDIAMTKLQNEAASIQKDDAIKVANDATGQLGTIQAAFNDLQTQIQQVAQIAVSPKVKTTKAVRVGDGQWVTETTETPVVNGG